MDISKDDCNHPNIESQQYLDLKRLQGSRTVEMIHTSKSLKGKRDQVSRVSFLY